MKIPETTIFVRQDAWPINRPPHNRLIDWSACRPKVMISTSLILTTIFLFHCLVILKKLNEKRMSFIILIFIFIFYLLCQLLSDFFGNIRHIFLCQGNKITNTTQVKIWDRKPVTSLFIKKSVHITLNFNWLDVHNSLFRFLWKKKKYVPNLFFGQITGRFYRHGRQLLRNLVTHGGQNRGFAEGVHPWRPVLLSAGNGLRHAGRNNWAGDGALRLWWGDTFNTFCSIR